MADWGGSGGYHNNANRNTNNANRSNVNTMNPGLRLRNYQGPFCRNSLIKARDELKSYAEHKKDATVWYRIRTKTAVDVYGTGDSDDGFGAASNLFSHAELPENREPQEEFQGMCTDVTIESPFSVAEGPHKSYKQTPPATVTHETLEVINLASSKTVEYPLSFTDRPSKTDNKPDLNLDGNKNNNCDNDVSDCLIFDETNEPPIEKAKNYNLDSDGIEVVEDEKKHEVNVFVVEDDSSESQYGTTTDMTSRYTYKCDFCDYSSNIRKPMLDHLNNAVHFAASEYTLDNNGRTQLKHKMLIMNFSAKFKTVIAACPASSCPMVYPEIHACAEHYKLMHTGSTSRYKRERNLYGLVTVMEEERCTNVVTPLQCLECFQKFNKRTLLNEHFEMTGHYPLTDVTDCFKVFFCYYCKTSFFSFQKLTFHQAQAHHWSIVDGVLQFTVYHCKDKKIHTLPLRGQTLSVPDEMGFKTTGSTTDTSISSTLGTGKRKYDQKIAADEPRMKITVSMVTDDIRNRQVNVGRHDENENSVSEELSVVDRAAITALHDYSSTVHSSLPSTSNTVNPNSSIESTGGEQGTLCEMFKCDYCSKMTKEGNLMYSHLVDMVHSSASTVLTDQQDNIVYLKRTKTVTYDAAQYEKIVASCPESQCRLLFDTIFMCNDHYIRCHKSKSACYSLVDVVDRSVSKVSFSDNNCSVCGQQFNKIKQLNKHYSTTNHYPYITRTDCDAYLLCSYCRKTFTSFKVACGHIKKHAASAINGMLDLIILNVSKVAITCTLPPYQCSTAGEVNSIRSKVNSLQHMKKICGKSGRTDISNEIRDLKKLL